MFASRENPGETARMHRLVLAFAARLCNKYLNPILNRSNGLQGFADNKGVDQPSHPRRLIGTFVIHFLESVISKLATCEISFF